MADEVYCPYCDTKAKFLFHAQDLNEQITEQLFDYYKCPNDGIIFLSPVPENLADYYPTSYYQIPSDNNDDNEFTPDPLHQFKIDILEKYSNGLKLLEIGSGRGDFLYLSRKVGFDVTAIEMDKDSCDFMQNHLKIPVIHTTDTLKSLTETGQYDVIAMWHVIEHLPNVWDILHEIPKHLNDDGILILTGPNPYSIQFRIFREAWYHLDAPRHVVMIPLPLLSNDLASYGLHLADIITDDDGSKLLDHFGWHITWERQINSPIYKIKRYISKKLFKQVNRLQEKPFYLAIFRKS